MRIEDLDEFEGLTAEMVREWLRAQAPRVRFETVHGVTGLTEVWTWTASGEQVRDRLMELCLAERVCLIASIEARSLQSLLREINFRMRPGWPTDVELQRHAWWLIGQPAIGVALRVTTAEYVRVWRDRSDPEYVRVLCWPCDEHGNKVRRAP